MTDHLSKAGALSKIEVPVLVVCTNESKKLNDWLENVDSFNTELVTPIPCIADNASRDETAGVIWDAIENKKVLKRNVIWNLQNYGFSAAQNQLIRMLGARLEYHWFATLNIDATATPDWLHRLICQAQYDMSDLNEKIGMWCGPIIDSNDEEKVSSAGHTLCQDGAFRDIDWGRSLSEPLFHLQDKFEPFCPCFAAGLWSFKMARDVGLPDSHQFLYYDDVELGCRARIHQWSACFVKDAIAKHPIPNSKKTIDTHRKLKQRGKLKIIARYLPVKEARALIDSLSADLSQMFRDIETNEKKPYREDIERRRMFDDWNNKWIAIEDCKKNGFAFRGEYPTAL